MSSPTHRVQVTSVRLFKIHIISVDECEPNIIRRQNRKCRIPDRHEEIMLRYIYKTA